MEWIKQPDLDVGVGIQNGQPERLVCSVDVVNDQTEAYTPISSDQ